MTQRLNMIKMVRSTRVSQTSNPCKELVIRSLAPDDAAIFGELLFESFRDSVHRDRWECASDAAIEAYKVFARKEIYFDASFVAFNGTIPVSMSVVESSASGPYLTYVGTVLYYRRCGLGGALVNKSLRALNSKGFVEAYLNVANRNKNAMSRYRSLGFEIFDNRITN